MSLEGNILILTQWSFKDALVQTYTLPYVNIIRKIVPAKRKIIVVTSEQPQLALNRTEQTTVKAEWDKMNMQLLPLQYKRFGIKKLLAAGGQLFQLYRLIKKERIGVIHAFCTPAGGICYLLSRLTGAKLVVDSYEPHAEASVENGSWKKNGLAFRILWQLEKWQTKKASFLIGTTGGMKDYAKEKYGVEIKNFFVKPACVDLDKFYPRKKNPKLLKELDLENKIVCVYAGKLGGIYYKEEVFNFIRTCYDYWKDDFRFLMLTNATKEETETERKRVGLPEHMVISRFIFHKDIPDYLSLGDFAINPVKPVPTKRYCTSIKDGEYWAMGLPVIISPGISDDSEIIEKEDTGIVTDFNNTNQFPAVVGRIDQLLKMGTAIKERITGMAKKYRTFEIARSVYKEVYG